MDQIAPGDINASGSVDLAGAILALQIVCGLNYAFETVNLGAGVNGDGRVGLVEADFVIQKVAELRD